MNRRRISSVVLAGVAAIALSGCQATTPPATSSSISLNETFQGCTHYKTQPYAQRAWKAAGAPPVADRDHDGRVCEGLSQHLASQRSCRRVPHPVAIVISSREYPYTAAHIRTAIAAGKERILHIDRAGAAANRKDSLRGIPTKQGFDRDEYPPAMSREGGAGAHVQYVPSKDNRGAGTAMGTQLHQYCNGQAFRLFTPSHTQKN